MNKKITAVKKDFLDSKKNIDEQMQALVNAIQEALKIATLLVKISIVKSVF